MSEAAILLVDDHPIVCEGYRALLDRQTGLRVCGTITDGRAAGRAVLALRPDLVILDLSMPDLGGLEVLPRLRRDRPSLRVLVLSMHGHAAFASQALRAGARGYVTKSSAPDIVVRAVRDVLAGRRALSPDIAGALAAEYAAGAPASAERLSPREFEVLRHLLAGRDVREIGDLLCLSPKTVANTRLTIRAKLEVRSDAALFLRALHAGWLRDSSPTT